jgi:hypothetical protein
MTKRIFIILFLFLVKLDLANAQSCDSAHRAALRDCDAAEIDEPLRFIKQVTMMKKNDEYGAVPVIETGLSNGEIARRQLKAFEKKCYESFTSCIKSCKQEAAEEQANNNPQGAQQAQQAEQQCSEKPAENHAAAKKAGLDLNQILPGLMSMLTALKGDGGAGGDACLRDPASCKVDAATNSQGTTLSDSTRTDTPAGSLDSGLNPSDAPAMGEKVDPSLAQFGQGGGSGSGLGGVGSSSTPGGRGRGVAEVNADGMPKINLNPLGGNGGGKSGGMPSMNTASSRKSSGNPQATRVSIDAEGKIGSVGNAVNKAMQARGLASEANEITAAHAFDNFQKVEKRFQSERNKLAELAEK